MRTPLMLVAALTLSACGAAGSTASSPSSEPAKPLAHGVLVIDTAAGDKGGQIAVEIARSDAERAAGLSGRSDVPDGHGMAFIYDEAREGSFWMKDTLLPLDIAFWDEDGTVVATLSMQPCMEDPCPAYDPNVRYVGAVEASPETFASAELRPGSHVALTVLGP